MVWKYFIREPISAAHKSLILAAKSAPFAGVPNKSDLLSGRNVGVPGALTA